MTRVSNPIQCAAAKDPSYTPASFQVDSFIARPVVSSIRLFHATRLQQKEGTLNTYRTKIMSTKTGTVKWFNETRGYGFIQQADGPDLFAHYNEIKGEGFKTLAEGQTVEFGVTEGQKGPQAVNITVAA